jgi:actin-related protein 9
MRLCERDLAHLLLNNTSVTGVLAELAIPPEDHSTTVRALARQVWQAGLVRVPIDGIAVREVEDEGVTDISAVLVVGKEKTLIESGMKRRATGKSERGGTGAWLDLITVEFRGKEVMLGKERHRFCDPLFDRNLLNFGDSLPPDELVSPRRWNVDGVAGHAVRLTDVEQRQCIWLGRW